MHGAGMQQVAQAPPAITTHSDARSLRLASHLQVRARLLFVSLALGQSLWWTVVTANSFEGAIANRSLHPACHVPYVACSSVHPQLAPLDARHGPPITSPTYATEDKAG